MASQEAAAAALGVTPVQPLHAAQSDASTLAYIVQRMWKDGIRKFNRYVQHV